MHTALHAAAATPAPATAATPLAVELPGGRGAVARLNVTVAARLDAAARAAGDVAVVNADSRPLVLSGVTLRASVFDRGMVQMGHLSERLALTQCGAAKLPLTLAPGQKVACAFAAKNAAPRGGAVAVGAFPVPAGVDAGQGPFATVWLKQ